MLRLACSRPLVSVRLARRTHTATSVVLRPYQEECINECLDWLDQGATRIGVSLPTGSGKTTVFISLLSRIAAREPERPMKTIVIVNSVELARQSAVQAAKMFPNWSVEIEQGAKHKATGFADFTAATYQTLLNSERLAKFDPHKVTAVIIDEAHHAAAPSYRKLLSHFHPEIRHPDPKYALPVEPKPIPVIGFSATFSRHDGLALGSVFERIVYHRDVLQMIDEDWLCDVPPNLRQSISGPQQSHAQSQRRLRNGLPSARHEHPRYERYGRPDVARPRCFRRAEVYLDLLCGYCACRSADECV
ncbi:P-loop containing nucleoside triphosphate hydrolase protein [Coprinellus micaceus]|uniref:P-loop containing nucleoside triphosphate hydrolase protein n=1 Tax=Coprinellus micaceus TaxID=71717 RepID=A0A4Y7TMR5_COPMI|nr:P-loop containing nucleoside triphosphate hydrolase protein [Coprinellus micaceus]